MAKRYYWLKLKEDFFSSMRIKKLRRLAGGDTYTIIYLKMQLKAMKNDGMIKYTGVENSIAEEIALDIDEDEENVAVTLNYLKNVGLLETSEDGCFFPYAVENVGSEQSSAQRVREHRERVKALHCNTDVTNSLLLGNGEIEKEIELDIREESKIAPQPTIDEYDMIVQSWNSIPHTINIDSIIPMTKRENELRICIATFGIRKVMTAILKVADSKWMQKQGRIQFDSFMNVNRMQKLLEGGYDTDFSEKREEKELDGYKFGG